MLRVFDNDLYKYFKGNRKRKFSFFLQVDPRTRLTISEVLDRLAAIGETRGYQLKCGLKMNLPSQSVIPQPSARPSTSVVTQSSPQPPRRPPPPNPSANHLHHISTNPAPSPHSTTSSQSTMGLLSSLKGGAGSLLKNLKVEFSSC